MRVAVVDHGMGNLRSVRRALEAAGAEATITAEPEALMAHDALCVPGQGIFGRCMDVLDGSDLGGAVRAWIGSGRPYLGICLGMQVLFDSSEESGGRDGLGALRGEVRKLPDGVRVPHIGWSIAGSDYMYFDHSYVVIPEDRAIVRTWCRHGVEFAASIESGPLTGVQFHPEKSSAAGLSWLAGWLERVGGRSGTATEAVG
jgi:imidazole glycerol-phosphate synthase subunit HisH